MRLSALALTRAPDHKPLRGSRTSPTARTVPGAATTSSPPSEAPQAPAIQCQEAPAAMEPGWRDEAIFYTMSAEVVHSRLVAILKTA
jgi:hypothetical protein